MRNDARTMLLGIAVIAAAGFEWVADAVRGWGTDPVFVGVGLALTFVGYLYGLFADSAGRDADG